MKEVINKMLTENQEWIDYHQDKLNDFKNKRKVILKIYKDEQTLDYRSSISLPTVEQVQVVRDTKEKRNKSIRKYIKINK